MLFWLFALRRLGRLPLRVQPFNELWDFFFYTCIRERVQKDLRWYLLKAQGVEFLSENLGITRDIVQFVNEDF